MIIEETRGEKKEEKGEPFCRESNAQDAFVAPLRAKKKGAERGFPVLRTDKRGKGPGDAVTGGR